MKFKAKVQSKSKDDVGSAISCFFLVLRIEANKRDDYDDDDDDEN